MNDVNGESGVAAASARAARAAGAWRRCGVRLVLLQAAREPPALRAWAGGARAELQALRRPAAPPGPFGGAGGAGGARAALHAHPWRGLVRTDRAPRPAPLPGRCASRTFCLTSVKKILYN